MLERNPLIAANERQAYLLGQIEHTMAALQFVNQVFTEEQTNSVEVYDAVGEIKFHADEDMRRMLTGGLGGLFNELVYEIGEYVQIDNPDMVQKEAQEHIIFDGENYQIYQQKPNQQMGQVATEIITNISHTRIDYDKQNL